MIILGFTNKKRANCNEIDSDTCEKEWKNMTLFEKEIMIAIYLLKFEYKVSCFKLSNFKYYIDY